MRRHVGRDGFAVLVAVGIATVATMRHSSCAMAAAVMPLAVLDESGQVLRASDRLAGTAVGIGVALVWMR